MTDERNGNGPPPGDDDLPRNVGYDDSLEEPLRETYVRVPYAIKLLGVTDYTVYKHLQRGTLAGTKVGRDWLVEREALRWWEPGEPGRPSRPKE